MGDPAGFRICFQYLIYRFQLPDFRFGKNHFNYVRNLGKTYTAIKKCGHCDLVGGIQCYSFCTSSLRCFIGQTQAREFSHVWRLKIEVS